MFYSQKFEKTLHTMHWLCIDFALCLHCVCIVCVQCVCIVCALWCEMAKSMFNHQHYAYFVKFMRVFTFRIKISKTQQKPALFYKNPQPNHMNAYTKPSILYISIFQMVILWIFIKLSGVCRCWTKNSKT